MTNREKAHETHLSSNVLIPMTSLMPLKFFFRSKSNVSVTSGLMMPFRVAFKTIVFPSSSIVTKRSGDGQTDT